MTSKYKLLLRGDFRINKPKMAYSRDLPKMARQQCGIMDMDDWHG